MPIRNSFNKRVKKVTRKTYKACENSFMFGLKNSSMPATRIKTRSLVNDSRIRNNEIFKKRK